MRAQYVRLAALVVNFFDCGVTAAFGLIRTAGMFFTQSSRHETVLKAIVKKHRIISSV